MQLFVMKMSWQKLWAWKESALSCALEAHFPLEFSKEEDVYCTSQTRSTFAGRKLVNVSSIETNNLAVQFNQSVLRFVVIS